MRTLAFTLALSATLAAAAPDKRLATATTATVVAADALSDDKPVAVCLADILEKTTAMKSLGPNESGLDGIVLTVSKTSISGDSMRHLMGSLGITRLTATTPDGTKLWQGGSVLSATTKLEMIPTKDVPCALADDLTNELRKAMRKARDSK